MNIGLDWDGTVTEAPYLWWAFMNQAIENGHKVYIVTMRYESEGVDIIFAKHATGVIYTGREAKQKTCEAKGVNIHVWIDDNPRAIHESAAQIWGNVSPEGQPITPSHGSEQSATAG